MVMCINGISRIVHSEDLKRYQWSFAQAHIHIHMTLRTTNRNFRTFVKNQFSPIMSEGPFSSCSDIFNSVQIWSSDLQAKVLRRRRRDCMHVSQAVSSGLVLCVLS